MSGKRFKCTYCGLILPAWLPVAKRPNSAMLLTHLSQHHRTEVVKRLLARMRTEDIATVAAEAFHTWPRPPRSLPFLVKFGTEAFSPLMRFREPRHARHPRGALWCLRGG